MFDHRWNLSNEFACTAHTCVLTPSSYLHAQQPMKHSISGAFPTRYPLQIIAQQQQRPKKHASTTIDGCCENGCTWLHTHEYAHRKHFHTYAMPNYGDHIICHVISKWEQKKITFCLCCGRELIKKLAAGQIERQKKQHANSHISWFSIYVNLLINSIIY